MLSIIGKTLKSRSHRPLATIAAVGAVMVGLTLVSAPTASARVSVVKLTQGEAQGQIDAVGVYWSASGGCSDRYNSTCTSLEQVNQDSITGISVLKNASGCDINITGGTEIGHADGTYSHWEGYKLDVYTQEGDCIYNYVTNSFAQIGTRGDGAPQYQSGSGNVYAWEYWANHWDITYYTCGC